MKKLLLWLVAILILFSKIFAMEVSLSTNKTNIDINHPFQLTIQIISDKNGTIQIQKIDWLENFKILWQSQYQSYSSSIVNINWQVKQKINTTYNVVFTLLPKKDGNFTIWPAYILYNWKTYKTNSVQIKVTWTKTPNIMLNQQNYTTLPNSPTPNNANTIQNNNPTFDKNTSIQDLNNSQHTNPQSYWFLVLTIILILIGIGIIVYLLKKDTGNQYKQANEKTKETEKEKTISINPNTSNDFLTNLWIKYNIKNIHSKTFSEIIEEVKKQWKELSSEELNKLENILINKFKA